ncbi:MAG TPA: hypothetical protein VNJ08_10010 [Bacteriovoracaceae bacterium]|nr:hypothetical protein [Bacteriovoracaceae bacterium]
MANDFLSFLVDETLKLQKSGEVELSSLEQKLNDYSLNFLRGEFIPQTQMLRFETSFGKLDVPINWSLFDAEKHTLLNSENDVDQFLTVLKTAWDPSFEKVLVTHADGFCYMVGLKAGEDSYLHDLLNPQEWLKTTG